MTEKLAEAFLETLLENNWLDNKTKNYARMKINEIDLKIGFPDAILNDTRLTEEYSAVKIHPNYFFENTLSILKYLTRLEQSKIGTAVNRTSSWRTPPTVVNAYYSRNKNQISNNIEVNSGIIFLKQDVFQHFPPQYSSHRFIIDIFQRHLILVVSEL